MGLQPTDWFRWEVLHHYRDPRSYDLWLSAKWQPAASTANLQQDSP